MGTYCYYNVLHCQGAKTIDPRVYGPSKLWTKPNLFAFKLINLGILKLRTQPSNTSQPIQSLYITMSFSLLSTIPLSSSPKAKNQRNRNDSLFKAFKLTNPRPAIPAQAIPSTESTMKALTHVFLVCLLSYTIPWCTLHLGSRNKLSFLCQFSLDL